MVQEVRQLLFASQDCSYQKFQSKLCPNVHNIIGVRVPILKKIAKDLLKQDYRSYLDQVDNLYYEETMLEGFLIGEGKMPLDEKFSYLDRFLSKIDNWAVCDICASSFHLKEKDLKPFWNYLKKYQKSKQEFVIRFLLVMYMNYYLEKPYLEKVLSYIGSINVDFYYVNMGISWLLSCLYVKEKERTILYLKNSKLSSWVYQKTLQKILESNQVSDDEKKKIRQMKKEKTSL